MKKSRVLVALLLAAFCTLQGMAQQPQSQAQPAQPGQQPAQQKKEIKDPAEYNAYVSAIQQQDVNAKISGLEAFVQQYPKSVVLEDALEALMVAYQQANNGAKVADAAGRLLQVNPHNLRGLALMAYLKKVACASNQDPTTTCADARKYAEQGLAALPTFAKPDGVSDADYQKQKTSFTQLFSSIAGFTALQAKDYPAAIKGLRASVEINPNNLEDVYPLALAYLTGMPDDPAGYFFIARAASLAQGPGKDQITKFGKSKYVRFHGSDEGWAQLLASTATTPLPTADLKITKYVPPTPDQQCDEFMKAKPPKEMDFAEWQLCLSKGRQEQKDKVWDAIKGQTLQMQGRVIKATATELQLAASLDDIDAGKPDITLTMTGPIPAKLMPKEGSDLPFGGSPASYTPEPFMMQMEKGTLLTTSAPAKPTPKRGPASPVRRKPAQ